MTDDHWHDFVTKNRHEYEPLPPALRAEFDRQAKARSSSDGGSSDWYERMTEAPYDVMTFDATSPVWSGIKALVAMIDETEPYHVSIRPKPEKGRWEMNMVGDDGRRTDRRFCTSDIIAAFVDFKPPMRIFIVDCASDGRRFVVAAPSPEAASLVMVGDSIWRTPDTLTIEPLELGAESRIILASERPG